MTISVSGSSRSRTLSAQSELTGDAAQEGARRKVDSLRSRERLAVRVPFDLRQASARVGLGVTGDRIIVKNTQDLGHIDSISAVKAQERAHWALGIQIERFARLIEGINHAAKSATRRSISADISKPCAKSSNARVRGAR